MSWKLWCSLSAAVTIWAVGLSALSIYRFSLTSETQSADAAIVLGAAVWRDQPSPVFRERLNHAIQLYHDGVVENIILTGGLGSRDTRPEALVGQEYVVRQGVPLEDTLVESYSTLTIENLACARAILVEEELADVLLVSDPLHMKRALLMAGDLGIDAYSSPTPTSRYRSWYSKSRFLIKETLNYLYYRGTRLFPLIPHQSICA